MKVALRNQGASIHNLENQLGQISKMLSDRTPRSLPSNTETNPKEHVKAITPRSGKELQIPEKDLKKGKEVEVEIWEKAVEKDESKGKELPSIPKDYQPSLPHPSRLRKDRDDEH